MVTLIGDLRPHTLPLPDVVEVLDMIGGVRRRAGVDRRGGWSAWGWWV